MASPADVTFPEPAHGETGTPWTGCDLRRVNRAYGGRSEQYGYESTRLLVGTSYWSGTARIGTLGKSHRDLAGSIEGALGQLVGGIKTFKVPIGRSGVRQAWKDSAGNRTLDDFSGDSFIIDETRLVSGMPTIDGRTLTVTLQTGTFVTVDHALHMAIDDQEITNGSRLVLDSMHFIPEIPAPATSTTKQVIFRNPYLVARVPADATVEMPHSDGWYGPYALPFNEAE